MRRWAPPPLRIRKPQWRDPRLGVGIILVAASVALGAWVVGQADRTVGVYRATDGLTAGDELDEHSLTLTQVHLDELTGAYLTEADLAESAVVTRSVESDELVPLSAVGDAADVDLRPITITTSDATQLRAGVQVDVWVAPTEEDTRTFGSPELIAAEVTVSQVHEDDSLFAARDGHRVEVLVDQELVPELLSAINSEAAISLVPLIGSDGA